MTPACARGMGIFIASTGTVGDVLFEVIIPLVCEGRCEAFLIGGAVPSRWCNARGSCIVVFKFGESVTSNSCASKDGRHGGGLTIGCVSGMTLIGFRRGFRGTESPKRTGSFGTCCFWMTF